MTKTYKITGMKCQGCVNTVTEKLSAVKGVDKVQVDLENKQVTICLLYTSPSPRDS